MGSLEEPLIPTPNNTGVTNFLAGFAAVSQANHRKELEALAAQRMIEKRQEDQQKFELQSQISAQNLDLKQQALEVTKARQDTYAQHVANELDKQGKVVQDVGSLSNAISDAETKYPLGSIARVQALDAAQNQYPDAAADIHGNRLFAPKYSEATRAYNNSLRDFTTRHKAIFGTDASTDPWANNTGWTKDADGRWRFPVWGYKDVQTVDPSTKATTVTSQPFKIKDVILDDATKSDMQKRYDRTMKGSESLPATRVVDQSEWSKAKAAMAAGKDPMAVKKIYQSKGGNPEDLDLDAAP